MSAVLLVDDEKLFLKSLVEGLSSALKDIQFLSASNGQEAIGILNLNKIDLIVTDIQMPVMDGYQLLIYLSNSRQKIPVIVMTAFGSVETKEFVNRHGSIKYIEKPIDFQVLLNLIEENLSKETKGHLVGIDLINFIQLIHQQRNTCAIKVFGQNKSAGTLYFENGEIIHAETEKFSGKEAFYEIVNWPHPEIGIESVSYKRERTLLNPLPNLLLDAAKQKDEKINETKRLFIQKTSGQEEVPAKQESEANPEESLVTEEEKKNALFLKENQASKGDKNMSGNLVNYITSINGVEIAVSINSSGEFIEGTVEKDSKLVEFISFLGGSVQNLDHILNLGKTNTVNLRGKGNSSLSVFIREGYYVGVQISNNVSIREVHHQIKNYLG